MLETREYEMTETQFGWVRRQVKERTGIHLAESKRNLVHNRLLSRLRQLGLGSYDEYFKVIAEDGGREMVELVNAITTNVTSFFRESHHFEYLADHALAEARARHAVDRRLRIWSAGCSTGMEPYSIAMVVLESECGRSFWDTKILATDLDTQVLQVGARGEYDASAVDSISEARRKQFILRGTGAKAGSIRVRPELAQLVVFRHLNLMQTWPMRGPFDVIFCRNVVIYFDKATQAVLWRRFCDLLVPGGYLFVGHSESVLNEPRFESVGRTIYRKRA